MRRWPPSLPVWLAAALALVLAQQPWWAVSWTGTASGSGDAPLTGTVATGGLAQSLALVALAGAATTLMLRATGRRLVAVLVGLAFAGAAALGLLLPPPAADAVREALGAASLADSWAAAPTAWPRAYGAVGVLGVVAAAALAWRPVAESSRPVRRTDAQVADSLASWKAMDDGLDPTTE